MITFHRRFSWLRSVLPVMLHHIQRTQCKHVDHGLYLWIGDHD